MKTCSSCRRHMRRAERTCPFCNNAAREIAAPLCVVLSLASVLVGCTEGPPTGSNGSSDSSSTTALDSTTGFSGSGALSTGAFETTVVDDDSATMDTTLGGGFIYGDPDGGTVRECDTFQQDCPEGEKCMAWANDGGSVWNATRCTPIVENPGQLEDPCAVEGSATSGIDDCDIGVMCWDVDVDTNMGTCVAMCGGDEDNPICNDPNTACAVANDGIIALCLPQCDPVLQDCAGALGCYPVDDVFVCVQDVSEGPGDYGSDCEEINSCAPGLVCLGAAATPGCGTSGCCTELCDLSDPAGDAQCTGALERQTCAPWFEEGKLPPELADIGVCTVGDVSVATHLGAAK